MTQSKIFFLRWGGIGWWFLSTGYLRGLFKQKQKIFQSAFFFQQQQQPTLVDRILGAAFVTDLVLAMNIKAQQPEYHHQKQTSPVHFDWVQILPIVCCFLYIILRIPQIRRNYIRKSATGLSLYMVLFTVLGTIFNLLSIVTDTNLYNVLSIKIFLIGSLVIVLMDGA